MKRREFVEKLGIGSAALVSGSVVAGGVAAPGDAKQQLREDEHEHGHRPVKGPFATATVSFGQWQSKDEDAPPPQNQELDRYPALSPRERNGHRLIPHQVMIKVGGAVNFVIGGFHNVNVYAPGTKPGDIITSMTRPTTGVPVGVPLINDRNNRVYSGLDPSTQPQDRVEVVHFPREGRHLVICGVLGHFVNDNMFGWVRVLPDVEDE